MKWTEEQQQVIDSRNSNLLVAAAAGSGKTAVLVERLVRRVVPESEFYKKEDYTDIDRMLVVTFTRDAASELRERVDKALDKRLAACTSSAVSELLYRQKSLLAKSYITTIDSFCMDVVKQNFVQCGIDPSFAIGDGTELELLEDDVLTELLEECYAEKKDAFLRVANTYMDKSDDLSLKKTLLKIYNFAQSDVNPAAWIETQKERYSQPDKFDFWDSVWGRALGDYFCGFVCDIYSEYRDLQDFCTAHGVSCYQKAIDEETLAFEKLVCLLKEGNYRDALGDSVKTLFCKSIGSARGENKTEYSETVRTRRSKAKESFEKLYEKFFKGSSPESQMALLCDDVACICDIVSEFQRRILEEKYNRRIYSFNDIAHFALELLADDCRKDGKGFVPTDIARRYQKQFDEIYIDEYQDTSIIQEILLNAVAGRNCGAKNIFMVGDIKQSIYGFRQACPEFFLEKYNSYGEKGCENRLICLYKNFRSRKNVVDGVNAVFSKIMTKATSDMDYTEKEYLNYGALYYDDSAESAKQSLQKCEMVIIGTSDKIENTDFNKADDHELQARFIAGKIIEMISTGYQVFDTSLNSMRPVRYSDFVILMRNAGKEAPLYANVLNSYGIPVFAPARKSFYSTPEISTLLAYLKIIDNPRQDIALMSVMRSPFFGFTDEDISLIKIRYKYPDLYDSCRMFANGDYGEDAALNELKGKLGFFFGRLDELRNLSGMVAVYDILWMIVNQNDFYNRIGMYENGGNSQANIRMLLDMADGFDNAGGQGLFKFIRNIQRLENENKEKEEASVCSESANVVRVKTIHKSKGLEFPFVFLTETDKKVYNDSDKFTENKVNTLLLHRKLGINPMCYESGKYVSITYPSVMRNVTETIRKKEQIAEEMRLLYVAITRAREKFFAVGTGAESDLTKYDGRRCNSFGVLNNAKYKDWILMSTSDATSWDKVFAERSDVFSYPDEMLQKYGRSDDISMPENSDTDIDIKISGGSLLNEESTVIPVKISVSDIKRIHAAKDEEENIQDFFAQKHGVVMKSISREKDKRKKRTFTPAEKGTLAHTCLQLLDFDKCREIDDVGAAEKYVGEFLKDMQRREVFSSEEVSVIERKIIVNFILSDIGKRIFAAEKVYRETPFTVRVNWREISGGKGGFGENEYVSVQGVIDCFIVENDGCVVIDYKTDYLRPESAAAVDDAYRVQIKCYSDAIEKITGRKVKESKIVYLRNL